MRQTYGIPYTGNKQKIAKYILDKLPNGERLVDLFGGGGAITHYAMLNYTYKWNSYLYNDINPLVTDLFKRAVGGEFNPNSFKPRWISRSEFNTKKDTDGYVKYIWSFGNNGDDYLFGEHLEEFKRNAHNYLVYGDKEALKYLENHYSDSYYWLIKDIRQPDLSLYENRLRYNNSILKIEAVRVCVDYGDKQVYNNYKDYSFDEFHKLKQKDLCRCIDKYCPNIPKRNYKNTMDKKKLHELKQLQRLEQLQQLQQLQRLEQLQQLQQLDTQSSLTPVPSLEITNMSYLDYEYREGDVVYCDIPYENTRMDYGGFNHEEFYKWCNEQPFDIYFSEYSKGLPVWGKQVRAMSGSKRFETLCKI